MISRTKKNYEPGDQPAYVTVEFDSIVAGRVFLLILDPIPMLQVKFFRDPCYSIS